MTKREKDQMRKIEQSAFAALITAEKQFGSGDKFTLATRAYWLGHYDLCQKMGVYENVDTDTTAD